VYKTKEACREQQASFLIYFQTGHSSMFTNRLVHVPPPLFSSCHCFHGYKDMGEFPISKYRY